MQIRIASPMLFCQAEVRFNGMLPGRFRFCVKYSERCRKRGGRHTQRCGYPTQSKKALLSKGLNRAWKRVDQGKSSSFRWDQPPQSGCVAALFGVIVLFCAESGSSRPVQPNRQPAQPPTEPDCSHRRWRGSPVRWKERGWRWGQCRPPSHSGSRKSAR